VRFECIAVYDVLLQQCEQQYVKQAWGERNVCIDRM
jgi:hypothetical protein